MKKSILTNILFGIMFIGLVIPGLSVRAEENVKIMKGTVDLSECIIQEGGFEAAPSYDQMPTLEGYEIEDDGSFDLMSAANHEYDEQVMSDLICQALATGQTEIDLQANGVEPEWYSFCEFYASIINGHPEFFYVSSGFNDEYYYDRSTGTWYLTKIYPVYKKGYDVDKFFEEADKAMSVIEPGMSDMEKVIALHEYLVLDCGYDYARYLAGTLSQHPDTYNAYGVLVDKSAVCNGYALAYMYLMNRAGVHTVIVTSGAVNHAWNMVNVDGEWYEVDCTWDDPIWDMYGFVRHNNLLCSDEGFPQNHNASDWVIKDNGKVVTDISATSTKYDNAFWKTGNFVSQIINHNGYYYYAGFGVIKKTPISDYNGKLATNVMSGFPKWYVWGSRSYYTSNYSSFENVGDRLIYSTSTTLNSMNFDGTDVKTLYTLPSDANGYIYGAHIRDEQMYIVIQQNPQPNGNQTLTPVEIEGLSGKRKVSEASLDILNPGIIGLMFYVENLDGTETVYINDVPYSVGSGNKVDNMHVFKCDVAAKDIYKDVELKVVQSSNPQNILKLSNISNVQNGIFYYSVSDYLNTVLSNSTKYDSKLVNVCDALLIYGDNANAYFTGGTSNKTSKVSIYSDSRGNDPLAAYDMQFIGDDSLKDRFMGASLVLDNSIALKIYCKDDSEQGYTYRTYSGFSANDIDDVITSKFDDGAYSIKYGPFSYIKKVRDNNNNPGLIQLMGALYGYWYYTEAYFK